MERPNYRQVAEWQGGGQAGEVLYVDEVGLELLAYGQKR